MKRFLDERAKKKQDKSDMDRPKTDLSKLVDSIAPILMKDDNIEYLLGSYQDLQNAPDGFKPQQFSWMVREVLKSSSQFDKKYAEDTALQERFNQRVKTGELTGRRAANQFTKEKQIDDQMVRLIFGKAAGLLKEKQPTVSDFYFELSQTITSDSIMMAKAPQDEPQTRKRAGAIVQHDEKADAKKRVRSTPPKKPLPKPPKNASWVKSSPSKENLQKARKQFGKLQQKTGPGQVADATNDPEHSPAVRSRNSRRSGKS